MSRPVPDPWVSTHNDGGVTTPERKKTPRRTWHAFSPHKVKSPESEIPTLQITHFTKKQIVCFEVVKTGRTRKRLLRLYNPHDYPQTVELERISPKKGFSLDERMWEVSPNSELVIPIYWTPPDEGTFRDLMTLLCEDAFRLQVILLGTAEDPARKVSGRRSTFLVKKSRPQKSQNPQMMRKKRVVGKENARPRVKKSPGVEIMDSNVTRDVLKASRVTPDQGELGGKPEALFNEQATSKALTELTNAVEPVKNVPLLNPARETLVVCPGMTPMLKSKKRQALSKKQVPLKSESGGGKPHITREDEASVEVFDVPTTARALTELTNAMEPVQNVPLQNPSRETLLVCPGMSPLLKSKKPGISKKGGSKKSTAARRVLNRTAAKAESNDHLGCPESSNRGGEGRVVLKGTEVKVHHSRGADLSSSIAKVSKPTATTCLSSQSPGRSQIGGLKELKGTEVKAHGSAEVTGQDIATLGISKRVLFTEADDDLSSRKTDPQENHESSELAATPSSSDTVADKASREREETPASMIPESSGVPKMHPVDSPMEDSLDDNDVAESGRQSEEMKTTAPQDVSPHPYSVDSPFGRSSAGGSSPDENVMEDSLEAKMAEHEQSISSEASQQNDLDNLKTSSSACGSGEKMLEMLESGSSKEGLNEKQSGGDEKTIPVSSEGRNNSCQSVGGEEYTEGNNGPVDPTEVGSDLDENAEGESKEMGAGPSQLVPEEVMEKEENIASLRFEDWKAVKSVIEDTTTEGEVLPDALGSAETDNGKRHDSKDVASHVIPDKSELDHPSPPADRVNSAVTKETDVTAVKAVERKPEKQGLVFIALDEKPKKRSMSDLDYDKRPKKLKTTTADPRKLTAGEETRGGKSSLSLNRTVALRRASATNTVAPTKVRAKPKMKKVVKGVPMSRLHLLRQAKTALPRHPMPFAAKNMFYDERWMDKQERGFVQWLNYVLTPEEEESVRNPTIKGKKIEASILALPSSSVKIEPAPTKEVLSMRAYTARRRLNRLRRCACLLFQSEPVVRVIQKIEAQVENRGLTVRTDRKIHADLGMKQNILMMILSYNPLWLRIGLETIYGELLPIEDNSDVIGLSRFIVTRLLGNPDIAQQFAHPTVPALFGPGYDAALAKFTLKKFLLLVFFLDKAKLTRLIDHDPCLFCKDAQFKSSRDLLLDFSRLYLKGEGDITRHLNYIGYSVTHVQKALDEYDFAVINLAKDLRDGIRLVRVTELLMQNWLLSHELRCPAISRLQKVHNVQVALDALSQSTNLADEGITAKAIVDGHREKTLNLLWNIIFSFKVETMLDEAQLKEETAFLWRNLQLKRNLDAVKMLAVKRSIDRPNAGDVFTCKSPKLDLLLQWCRAVCAYYDLPIENFTVSFCDGRAFCYMVHHYHPELIATSSILDQTTQTEACDEGPAASLDDSLDRSWSPTAFSQANTSQGAPFEQLKKNEQANFKTLYSAMKSLGGVPFMIKASDMSGTIPDEKVVITYVSYVCARLLDLCKETRSVRTIQLAWRRYKLGKMLEERKAQQDACVTLQRWIRGYLNKRLVERQTVAAVRLQTAARGWLARRELNTLKRQKLQEHQATAAIVIQTYVRCWQAQKRFKAQLAAVVRLQSLVRGWRARRSLDRARRAVQTIEGYYLSHKMRIRAREEYQQTRRTVIMLQAICRGKQARGLFGQMKAARTIQASWRGYRARTEYQTTRRALTIVQSAVRMYLQRSSYQRERTAAIRIQEWYRATLVGRQVRSTYITQRASAVTIQAHFRGYQAREAYARQRIRCILVQSTVRGFLVRRRYQRLREAAVTVQRRYRAKLLGERESCRFQSMKSSAVTLQSALRGWLVRRELAREQAAACMIQSWYRGGMERKRFLCLKMNCIVIQCYIRAHQQRRKYLAMRDAALTIQKMYRGQQTRKMVKRIRSAIRIQATYRMFRARRDYKTMIGKLVTCQAVVRGFIARRKYSRTLQAAKIIQAYYRGYLQMKSARGEFCRVKEASLIIQSVYRGYMARRDYQIEVTSIIKCQAAVRGFLARQRYRAKLGAIRVIQKCVHAYLKMKSTRREFLEVRCACIALQSVYRGYKARQDYHRQVQRVITCQKLVRGFAARREYQRERKAALIIQRYHRAQLAMVKHREEYQQLREACIVLQAAFRGYCCRQQYTMLKRAATSVQSQWRMVMACRQYRSKKAASIMVQRRWRETLAARCQREDYLKVKQAAIVLQSAFRGHRCREYVRYLRKIILCQSIVRMFTARARFKKDLELVIKLQARVRACIIRRQFVALREATTVLQRRWRAILTGREEHLAYHVKRGGIITIQASVRSWLARKRFSKMRDSAVRIQTAYRRHSAMMAYQNKRHAIMTLQAYTRAFIIGRAVREQFVNEKTTAIVIQSWWRMAMKRKQYQKLRSAVITVQKLHRRHVAVRKYQEQITAISTLQKYARAFLESRAVRREFLRSRYSAVCIQSWWRMKRQQRDFERKRTSAIMIQSAFRRHRAMQAYKIQRQAVLSLQTFARAFLVGKALRQEYQLARSSAVLVQAWWRMTLQRRRYESLRAAVISVQARLRMVLAMRSYHHDWSAIVAIQRRWKANRLTREALRRYAETRKAIITLQALARGRTVRRTVALQHKSAVVIQAKWKAFVQRKRYVALQNATVAIQRRYRALASMRAERDRYERLKDATIVIQCFARCLQAQRLAQRNRAARLVQSTYRMYRVRANYQKLRSSAVTIQAVYRGHVCHRRYLRVLSAAVTIQTHFKAYLEGKSVREELHHQHQAALVIQTCYRRYTARRDYNAKLNAAIKIQSFYRCYKARHDYRRMRDAAITLQEHWRASRSMKAEFLQYHVTRGAIITIQSQFRAYLLRQDFLRRRAAAVVLQKSWRGFRCRRDRAALEAAVLCLQRRWRARREAREVQENYEATKRKVVQIQSLWRAYLCRRSFLEMRTASIKIQAWSRGYQCRKEYLQMKAAATVFQEYWRAKALARECRQVFVKTRRAIIVIQSVFRMRNCQKEYSRARNAAVVLQAWARGTAQRREFLAVKEAALVLQRRWHARQIAKETQRAYLEEKRRVILIQSLVRARRFRRDFLKKRSAVILIQSRVRGYLSRQKYCTVKRAAMIIQTRWRARKMALETQRAYLDLRRQVILVQSLFRARKCRKEFLQKKTSVILIQSCVRGYLLQQRYSNLKRAAAIIQTRWRAKKEGSISRERFLSMKTFAIVIQSSYRAFRCRQRFLEVRRAVVMIQAHSRGLCCLSQYRRMKGAAVTIQRWYRTILLMRRVKEEFELVTGAALKIQSVWRGYVARRRAERLRWEKATAEQRLGAAFKLQCWTRSRLQRIRYLRLREGALLAQRLYRARLRRMISAAVVIQSYVKMWLARKRVRDRNRAATTIQAIWRGRAVRRSTKSKKIARARARCLKATRAATEDKKLCNRTTSALDFLLGYKYLDQVLEAVSSLEVATRLSSHCCERLVAGQAVPVLFCLIRNCNRSLPCMEVIKHTVATLVNLAKYAVTAPSVLDCTESVTSLLELMMIYRETNPVIATKTAVLLMILGQHENIRKIILATPKVDEKLRSLRYLHERKQKLKTQQRIAKSRSKGLGLTPSATPSKKARPRRQFQPDWVLGRDKRPEPSEPLDAIKCLNNVLGVK